MNYSLLLIVISQVLSVCCDISQILSVLHQAECVYMTKMVMYGGTEEVAADLTINRFPDKLPTLEERSIKRYMMPNIARGNER